jgi:hypothetical protein
LCTATISHCTSALTCTNAGSSQCSSCAPGYVLAADQRAAWP